MNDWLKFVKENPHEFTIQYPPRREYFKENFKEESIPDFDIPKTLLLYLHVPFCEAKCYFCNFAVDVRNKTTVFESYVNALSKEIRRVADQLGGNTSISGIDIGGGTPTLLPNNLLEKILVELQPILGHSKLKFPLSIETTPRIAADRVDLLKMLVDFNVKRVSMGIQSFNAKSLFDVNRKIQIQKNELAVKNIRTAGFDRFNADLIFGLPNQTIDDWRFDLEQILILEPDSITTYDCLYRGKGRALSKKTKIFPTMEVYGEMYDLGYNMLTGAGYYAPYGSVNFSRNKRETGTSAYFEGRLLEGYDFLGLGNYASSQVDNYWFFNTYMVDDYIKQVNTGRPTILDFYNLPKKEQYAKYLLYSLNFGYIDGCRFEKKFGVKLTTCFKQEIELAISKGWLENKESKYFLKYGNFNNLNYLRSLFYSRDAKDWLLQLVTK